MRRCVVVSCLAVLGACGRLGFDPLDGAGDGDDCVALWLAGTITTDPTVLANVNTVFEERNPYLTEDGQTFYFSSNRGGEQDIYRATRVGDELTNIAPATELNSTDRDLSVAFTVDGLTAFVTTDRAGATVGGTNVWQGTRTSTTEPFAGFTAAPLVNVNTDANEYEPFPSRDGLRLYVNTGNDVAVASRQLTTENFGAPVPIAELNTAGSECCPAPNRDERVIVFISDSDVYYATRAAITDPFSAPQLVPGASVPGVFEVHTYLTPDACTLYFSSERAGGPGTFDLYVTGVRP